LKNPKEAKKWIKLSYENGSEDAKKFWEGNKLWEY
tara:strand:+ start:309 stop:413 length:105 start_codon:yes stop_codon:yes gene_type:complete